MSTTPSTRQETTVRLPVGVAAKVRDLRGVLDRANRDKPDPAALADLRAIFDAVPELWQHIADVTAHIQSDIITAMVAGAGTREAVTRQAGRMRDDLGYHDAAELERGLIDHIVTCWLRLSTVEWRYTHIMAESITFAQADYWERRLTAAQRRYERACETLARVRRLSRPTALQVNIGERQVNMAAGPAPAQPE